MGAGDDGLGVEDLVELEIVAIGHLVAKIRVIDLALQAAVQNRLAAVRFFTRPVAPALVFRHSYPLDPWNIRPD